MQIEKKWMIFFYESMKKARSLSLINVRRGEKVYDSWGHFCCVLFHAKNSRWLNKDDWSQVCWCGLADLVRSRDGHRWRMCRSVCAFMVAPDPTPGVPDGDTVLLTRLLRATTGCKALKPSRGCPRRFYNQL